MTRQLVDISFRGLPNSRGLVQLLIVGIFGCTLIASPAGANPVGLGATYRISVNSEGTAGNYESLGTTAVTADGRYAAFSSYATNLVPGDTNGVNDVFVRDRHSGITERVSVGPNGTQGDGESVLVSMSTDGRFVAFSSNSTNLTSATLTSGQIYVRDRQMGQTVLASTADDEMTPNGASGVADLSADGRWLVFVSRASNLVPNDNDPSLDVFVRDLVNGATILASVSSAGEKQNYSCSALCGTSISDDGQYVVFTSPASNLVSDGHRCLGLYVRDVQHSTTRRIAIPSDGTGCQSWEPVISGDGQRVAFTSNSDQLFRYATGGRQPVWASDKQVYLWERGTGDITLVSDGLYGQSPDRFSEYPSISSDGLAVVFMTASTNVVLADAWSKNPSNLMQYVLKDVGTGNTEVVTVRDSGVQSPGNIPGWDGRGAPAGVSVDGRFVSFPSYDYQMADGDSTAGSDIFLRDRYGRCLVGCS